MHPIDAIIFDVIGTLVNEDQIWADAASELVVRTEVADPTGFGTRWARLLNSRMDEVVRGVADWRPHQQLVVDSAREAVQAAGGRWSSAAEVSIESLDARYPAWPDVAAATAALRRGRLVAGLSNGDLSSLTRLANLNAISWDAALSTGTVRTFKPAPAAYEYALHALSLDPARSLFVAAHPWDLRAAAMHGFRTAYIARPGAEPPAGDDRFDLAVGDLAELASLLI